MARSESARPHDAPVWQVQLLGGLRLRRGTLELTRLPSRAATALLARFALEPRRAHAREELITLLWPDVSPGVGRNRLRQVLSTLKSILEPAGSMQPVLLADRDHVRVVEGALACDAVHFEASARAGRCAEARAAYAGELLPGWYEDWIQEERLRLAALHERLPPAAGPSATPKLASSAPQPLPPALAQPSAAGPLPRVVLPNYLTRMYGADEQARRLREQLLAHRLVTVIGAGGTGKTRLAVEVAHSLRPHGDWPSPAAEPAAPFDLIAFIGLAACSSADQALDALLAGLQMAPAAGSAIDRLIDALHHRRALLVLDNFEQLVTHGTDLVARLLTRLPQLHLLVTSRRALALDGEREFALGALELPQLQATLEEAAHNPAVALFVERARAVRADFHLSARNAGALVGLVRELEGMPLAIELAAARVRSIAPAELLERLRGPGTPRLDWLARSGAGAGGDARHASMQRVIAWSWDQLTPAQARLLSALTVFVGGFDARGAAALMPIVWGVHEVQEVHEVRGVTGVRQASGADAQLLLDDLTAHSLLRVRSEDETVRFNLYEPIREFAAARMDDASRGQVRAQLRDWALQWARALPATLPLPALRAELPNLVAALASAVEDGADEQAVYTLLALRGALQDVGLPAEGLQHARSAVERCADPVLRARAHTAIAPSLFLAGQREAALEHAQQGLQRELLDPAARTRALLVLARLRWRSGRRGAEVMALLSEAQALLQAHPDAELQAALLALRPFIDDRYRRDPASAERLHEQALALLAPLGDRHAVHGALYHLAVCAEDSGRPALALERIGPVIEEARLQQDWHRLSQALNMRGNAWCDLRRYGQALADYQECLRVAWQAMVPFDLAFGLWNLPRTLARLRRPEAALHLAAFAARYWSERFGELVRDEQRYLLRVRRLCALQLEPARIERLWREGEQLSLAQAVALALTPDR